MDKIFLVGIGGAGMSRLALLFKGSGYEVLGSDIRESEYTEILKLNNIKVFIGHSEAHIDKSISLLVYSSAVKETNPEVSKAKKLGIKVLKRGEALASVVNKFNNIIISGTHGKTTTTSIIGHILKKQGYRVNVYVGGRDNEFDEFYSNPDFFVVESDESDGSFLFFNPRYLVITNIDKDHLNHYDGSFEKLKNAFSILVEKSNRAVVCGLDKNAIDVVRNSKNKTLFYGVSNFKAENIEYLLNGTKFDLVYDNGKKMKVFSPLFGDKNVLNVLASLLVLREAGIPIETSVKHLRSFVPPSRRMEIKKNGDFILVDDHADHPTEIEATLSALRKHFPGKRLIAVFQPHRYSRMKLLGKKVAEPFSFADEVVVTEIFPAFEKPIENITGKGIANYVKEKYPDKNVYFTSSNFDAAKRVNSILKKGDMVVLLGPGDIGELSELIFLKGDV